MSSIKMTMAAMAVALFSTVCSADGRIDEIEAALPERPCADGAPASDRAKWDALAATKEGKMAIRNAARISGVPNEVRL